MGIEVLTAHWPLVLATFPVEEVTESDLEAYIAEMEAIHERGSKYATVVDVSAARRPLTAKLRGRIEAWLSDEPAIDPPDVAGRLHRVECQHALALALERLEDLCRRLIAALYVEDPRPSYDEIARRLGRPIGSLGPTRARCLEKLRKKYVEQGGPEP